VNNCKSEHIKMSIVFHFGTNDFEIYPETETLEQMNHFTSELVIFEVR
jgi:hypothetical protein